MTWEYYAALDVINRLLHGDKPFGGAFPSGCGIQLFTKSRNLPPQGKPFEPSADFEAAYRKAWGVSLPGPNSAGRLELALNAQGGCPPLRCDQRWGTLPPSRSVHSVREDAVTPYDSCDITGTSLSYRTRTRQRRPTRTRAVEVSVALLDQPTSGRCCHGLGLGVDVDRSSAVLAPPPGLLVAAERQSRIEDVVAVDPHGAGPEIA